MIGRGTSRAAARWLTLGLVSSVACVAWAQPPSAPDLGVGKTGLPEVSEVPLLRGSSPGQAALAGSLGYGYTEDVLHASDNHQRIGLQLGFGYDVLRWLAVAARFDGRYDAHFGGEDNGDDGVLGATRLLGRAGWPVLPQQWLGGEVALRIPPAQDLATGFATLGADLRVLTTRALTAQTELSASAGVRIDRSANGVDGVERLSAADRIGLSASESHAILVGLAGGHRLGDLLLLGEWSWDVLFGSKAPTADESPMRFTLGGRYAPEEAHLGFELMASFSPSARPSFGEGAPLVPIEPRVWLTFGVSYAFLAGALPGTLPPPLAQLSGRVVNDAGQPVVGAEVIAGSQRAQTGATGEFTIAGVEHGNVALRLSAKDFAPFRGHVRVNAARVALGDLRIAALFGKLSGRVLDENGSPVGGAKLSVAGAGRETSSNLDGTFELNRVPVGAAELYVQAAPWKALTMPVTVSAVEAASVEVRLLERLPVGQIRGTVRGTKGEAVLAKVDVIELNARLDTTGDGTFALDVQPGHYTVIVTAEGFDPERREVDVEHNGVTVLLIDLRATR